MSGFVVIIPWLFLMPNLTNQSVLQTEVGLVPAFKSFFEYIKNKRNDRHCNDECKNDAHFN